MAIHDHVINEMRAKPYTMVALLGLIGAVTFMWTTRSQYAMAGDLTNLTNQVQELQTSVNRGNLETQLRAINSELFAIQQKMQDLRAASKPIEQIYYDRLSTLQSDKEQLALKLAKIK